MAIFLQLLITFIAFPDSKDALLGLEDKNLVDIDMSGCLGVSKNGKCHPTFGTETLVSDEKTDWCSKIPNNKNDKNQNPWIQYSIKGKQMIVEKIRIRNGCCRYFDCCYVDDNTIINQNCCCKLYSYSILASNDKKKWKLMKKVEKDKSFYTCEFKTFEINAEEPYRYYRITLDEEFPGCPKCMQINQVEFYGESMAAKDFITYDGENEDESISIIGKVRKNE